MENPNDESSDEIPDGVPDPISERQQSEHFVNEVTRVIDRFRVEYHVSYGMLIGNLEFIKLKLFHESQGLDDED